MTSAPAGATKFPLLLRSRVSPPGPIKVIRADAPGEPPDNPNGGVTFLSQQTVTKDSRSRIRHDLLTPSPPLQVPAPPLSIRSAYSSTRSGKLISSTSIGVFIIFPIVVVTA